MNDDPVQTLAEELVARGHDALIERLRVAFAQAAAAHADIIQLDDARLEEVVQNFAPRADGLQWRRALATVAAEELEIDVGQALNHPAVARAQQMLGAPSYEDSLAELISRPVPESPEAALAEARNGAPAPFADNAAYAEEPAAYADEAAPADPSGDPEPSPYAEEPAYPTEEHEQPTYAEQEQPTYAEEPAAEEPEQPAAEEPEQPTYAGEAEPPAAEQQEHAEPPLEAGEAEPAPAPWESAAFETVATEAVVEPEPEPEPEPWAAAAETPDSADPDEQTSLGFEPELPYAAPEPFAAPPAAYGDSTPPLVDAPDPYGAETQSYEVAGAGELAELEPDEGEFDPAELDPHEGSRFAALPAYDPDEAAEDRLRVTAIHLGGVANLTGSSDSVDLRLSEAGLDIMRDEDEIIGRLGWADIEMLEVPNPRGLRRRRGMSRAQLIVRTPSGDASFEIPAFSSDELRQRIEPLVDRFGRH